VCEHKDFAANVAVNRMEDSGRFMADVTVRCKDCDLPFQFFGFPIGLDFDGVTISPDATEVRLPIVPYGEAPTILGDRFVRGFKITAKERGK
jgi:hypothetical protein